MQRVGMALGAMLLIGLEIAWLGVSRVPTNDRPVCDLSNAGDSSRRETRLPLRPDSPLPPAPVAPEGAVASVLDSLSTISDAADRSVGRCGNVYFGGSHFLFDRDFYRREARLLANAFPEASELVAEDLLGGKDVSSRGLHIACEMLSCLASGGNRRAELLLVRRSTSQAIRPPERQPALYALLASDRDCLYKALYRQQWRHGADWACGLLDIAPDAASLTLLEKVSSDPAEPDYIREDVNRALSRLHILRSPDAKACLSDLILRPPVREHQEEERKWDPERRWALRAALARHLDLRAILRKRLDRDLESARARHPGPGSGCPLFDREFKESVYLFPGDWDDALLTYVAMGGVPNELERTRLNEFGYLCDPKKRLGEILERLKVKAH